MIKDVVIRVSPQVAADNTLLQKELERVLRGTTSDSQNSKSKATDNHLNDWIIIRRSTDARQRNVVMNLTIRCALGEDHKVEPTFCPAEFRHVGEEAPQVIIVGAGPAGLFAALKGIALGVRPIVVERGKDVDSRRLDLTRINREKKIIPESNYCFGEGGAGAFSDGKLFTRSKKRGNVEEVLQLLHQFGAPSNILIESHPHIGSDRLPKVISNIREEIIRCGGEFHFETRMTELLIEDGMTVGVEAVRKSGSGIEEKVVFSGPVILATGHSAHDVYRMLDKCGVVLEPKGIAIGVRLEHPQKVIDQMQYHSPQGRGKYLPAAEYNFVTQVDGRGVYSFCMCPGGVIVPAGSSEGELVVNGMSASARAGGKANSGIVVEIRPGDFPEFSRYGNFEILELQESLERKFYEAAGNTIVTPAQRMADFINGKDSVDLPSTSYIPGIFPARIDRLLPGRIAGRLRQGLRKFGEKCKGFVTNEAALIGLESRTSSPVRIPRDRERLHHIAIAGLYPAGEGAGYAGGIVSAAIDGMRCMEECASFLAAEKQTGEDNTDKLHSETD